MRLSLVTGSVAIFATLLVGCSSSSQGTVPGDVSQQVMNGTGNWQRPPMSLTRAQVATLHPSVLPAKLLQKLLHEKFVHPRHIKRPGPVNRFVTDDSGYIWALQSNNTFVSYISDCSGAEGGIVDHAGRLIVACTNTGTVNIYNAGNFTGPADTVLAQDTGSDSYYPVDAFEDNAGNVYATNLYALVGCNPNCTLLDGSIAWWPPGSPTGATPSGSYTDPNMHEDYFGDVDANGNVYMDGENQSSIPEVDEITNIATMPSVTNMGITLHFPGGVYVMSPNGAAMLSVVDQGTYTVGNDALYVWTLPYTGQAPLYTDNPPQNVANLCDPVAGGYNANEHKILIGDAGCHADQRGAILSNNWLTATNFNFNIPVMGMFINSDK